MLAPQYKFLGLALLLLMAASRVSAHHSFAMYDATKLVPVVGTVKEFQWTNPHVILWVTKDSEQGGEPEPWTIELPTSTGNLSRMNWTKRSLVPGDRVTVEINPLRDGQHGGSFKKATVAATGQVLIANPPAASDAGPSDPAAADPAAPAASASNPAAAHDNHNGGCACVAVTGSNATMRSFAGVWAWLMLMLFAQWRRLRRFEEHARCTEIRLK
jgi:hypothetical protein